MPSITGRRLRRHKRGRCPPLSLATLFVMDFIRHRGPDEEVDAARPPRPPTLTPGTENAMDDLADVLSNVQLKGDTPPRATRATPPRTAAVGAASAYTQGATASLASLASPVRRSPRLAPPHTPPAVDSDEGASLLAGVLAKAASAPLPLSSELTSSALRSRTDAKREAAKPKLVVRYKRETVAAAAGAAAASSAGAVSASSAALFASDEASLAAATEATVTEPARTFRVASAMSSSSIPSLEASSYVSTASASASASASALASQSEKGSLEEKPTRRGAELRASLPHATPTRKARSKRDTRLPADTSRLSAFARFRDQFRSALAEKEKTKRAQKVSIGDEPAGDGDVIGDGSARRPNPLEAGNNSEMDSLADALAAGVTLGTPSRRTPARALVQPDASVGKVGLCYSDIMELHAGPAHHFERPARHAEVVERFKRRGLELRCESIEARPATDTELLLVHSRAHLHAVKTAFDVTSEEKVQGEGDIYWTKHTETCARIAAGSATAAALAVASGEMHRAFAVVRPPGHHAECARAMGFCFFNNTVVAARAALRAYPARVRKVLLLDWDVHHGNGIQDVTFEDDAIMYVSLHRKQEGFYPETGDAGEIGSGSGRGFNVNVPWPEKGLSDADYLAAFDLLVEPVATAFAPDLVIVAAGYDAAEGDPLGGMRVSDQGYALMTERLMKLAGGKLVCALEGGYGLTATANAAAATLTAMLGFKTPPLGSRRRPRRGTVALLRSICAGDLAECWPVLRSPEHLEKLREAESRGTLLGKSEDTADEPKSRKSLAGGARPTVTAVPVPATPLRRAATPT